MACLRNTSQRSGGARAGIFVVLILGGCAAKLPEAITVCPGKINGAESIEVIKAHSESIIPLKASGECKLQYHTEDGQKYKERFPIKVRIVPPNRIYIQGGPAFVPKAIVLGANEREFWVWLKPENISIYWWGQMRETEGCAEMLPLNPYNVLEALGVVEVEEADGWSLWNNGVFDVLERQAPDGSTVQRIFINCCDYLTRRIEYFDGSGRMVLITMLEKYKPIRGGFSVPRSIKIIRFGDEDKHDFIDIKLCSIQPAHFSSEQLDFMFSRPEPKGFEHVYRIGQDCELIGQQRQ